MLELKNFEEAKKRVDEVILPTPLIYSPAFSKESRNTVYIKPENLQRTGAFKIRGAYNKIMKMDLSLEDLLPQVPETMLRVWLMPPSS